MINYSKKWEKKENTRLIVDERIKEKKERNKIFKEDCSIYIKVNEKKTALLQTKEDDNILHDKKRKDKIDEDIEKKKATIFSGVKELHKNFPICENFFFWVKNELINAKIIKNIKEIKNDNNGKKDNQMQKRKINISNNDILFKTYIIVTLIKFIIMNIFCHIKGIISALFYFQYSTITLKIKGIGENSILGNPDRLMHFESIDFINYLKEVYINGNKTEIIDRKYIFNQTDNFIYLIWDENIINCQYMFSLCSNIIEIDLSNFNTSQVTSMNNMFEYCSSLHSLNLSNFNTSQVKDMHFMFYSCSSLTSIDLTYFNTSQVKDMDFMFNGCELLISLDLSNFNTSQVTSMSCMFCSCSSLISLDLSNFNTSQVQSMQSMFQYCYSLSSLNLSNFNTSQIKDMAWMFQDGLSLKDVDV